LDAKKQLVICLRSSATGAFQQLVEVSINIHWSTWCLLVNKVSRQLVLLKDVLKMPSMEEMPDINRQVIQVRNFARVIGTIDGTHTPTQSSGALKAKMFQCRKGIFFDNHAKQSMYDEGYKVPANALLNPEIPAEKAYNISHKATRSIVERCMEVFKRRFPCLLLETIPTYNFNL
ncbi:hypothetical protein ILUMI_13037, partial [Ignelater luminosus]